MIPYLLLALRCAAVTASPDLLLAAQAQPLVNIVVAAKAPPADRTAAAELAHYLGQIAGCQFAVVPETTGPAVRVGRDALPASALGEAAALTEEAWRVRRDGNDLLVYGGGVRGTLYAAYHLLEDVFGVHWWSPWDESVPSRRDLTVGAVDLSGQPRFAYRDIYMIYGRDGGRFAARNRLNREGDAPIDAAYGGGMEYGPPYHVHTFYMYFPPDQYFAQHPEWYALDGGQRVADYHQLCLSNPELRSSFLTKLRENIDTATRAAEAAGRPAPSVYSISQNDWLGPCQCAPCQAIVQREGSESGVLLDFVNYLADGIAADYPAVFLDTLAYQYTQAPPRSIRPRPNVIVRLCDTGSSQVAPITSPTNRAFHDFVLSWAAVAPHLRIWDYAVTYADPVGLPMPTVQCYAPDYRFYAAHRVVGVFTELEYELLADLRDYKVWMMCKLLEDPSSDPEQLTRVFTDGYFGPAGPAVRDYLRLLREAAATTTIPIAMAGGLSPVGAYLTAKVTVQAQQIFDRAEAAVGNDDQLLARVRFARLSLDRATVMLRRAHLAERAGSVDGAAALPDRAAVAARYQSTWRAEAARRLDPNVIGGSLASMAEEVARYTALPERVPEPAKFAHLPAGSWVDLTAEMTRNWESIVKVVRDDTAESGFTNRLEFPVAKDPERHAAEKYKLPMPWGVYDGLNAKGVMDGSIGPTDVPGPGYHWYRLGQSKLQPGYYLWFFWSWIIQLDLDAAIDPAAPDQEFDIWASLKFEGPDFPHGTPDQADAINVERVVLVKAAAAAVTKE